MRFNEANHLRHLLKGKWEPLFSEDGDLLVGIAGRSGACEMIENGEFGIDLIQMRPGTFFPLHTHPGHHLLYGLNGSGHVHIDGKDYAFSQGDSIYIAADYPHGVSAKESKENFDLLAIGYPHKKIGDYGRMKLCAD